MKKLTEELIKGKKVLLRMDIDVPIKEQDGAFKVADDLRLEAGLDTLDFCLEHGSSVIVMGHIGRPSKDSSGNPIRDDKFSVKPIVDWFEEKFSHVKLPEGKLHILENLRFEGGESFDTAQDREEVRDFAHELASLGEVFINESFAAYRPSASTTILPTLLPSAAGFRFASEVDVLTQVRNNPKKPLLAILGGAKVEEKKEAVLALSKIANTVLVGGKLAQEIREQRLEVAENVILADLTSDGEDITLETVEKWKEYIFSSGQIIWNGPLGRVEDHKNDNTEKITRIIIDSGVYCIVGGGDTLAYINKLGFLNKFSFYSTGGGAMLELLIKGTLPTIEALNQD